jgi:hypothetical protein
MRDVLRIQTFCGHFWNFAAETKSLRATLEYSFVLDHGIEVVGRNRPALIPSAMTSILRLCKEKR